MEDNRKHIAIKSDTHSLVEKLKYKLQAERMANLSQDEAIKYAVKKALEEK